MSQIKIVGNINATTNVSRYKAEDQKLISSKQLINKFGLKTDYIEFHISDIGGSIIYSDFNYKNYKSPSEQPLNDDQTLRYIEIDPINDLKLFGYSSGEFNVQYNFFRNILSDAQTNKLFIKEISSDRTEIRTTSLGLSNDEIEEFALELIANIKNTDYYKDYLLNFGNNNQAVAVNIALVKNPDGYEILFKLYEPLSQEIIVKSEFWVVDEIIQPYILILI